jgi:toxin-antitoxin system PIN domain toxin
MVSLLDVNVLLALAWPNHQHHALAEAWFLRQARSGWATCALTELGFVRLSSNPAYSRNAVSPLDAIELLSQLRELGKHHFWKALPSVLELERLPLAGHQQLNDALLVVQAEQQQGRVITFDAALRHYTSSPQRVLVLEPG